MREFETYVYLDTHKTGSSFVASLLYKYSSEKEIKRVVHGGMGADYDRSKFYFISIRDPYEQYLSLYSFGCRAKGQLFERLERQDLASYYDGSWKGFKDWLTVVLKPDNAQFLGNGYGKGALAKVSRLVGFQSYRVLLLAVPDAPKVLADCDSKEAVLKTFRERSIVNFTVRQERIRSDLSELIRQRLHSSLSDPAAAIQFVETEEAYNSSDRVDRYVSNPRLGMELRQRLKKREWLMYEVFGYHVPEK